MKVERAKIAELQKRLERSSRVLTEKIQQLIDRRGGSIPPASQDGDDSISPALSYSGIEAAAAWNSPSASSIASGSDAFPTD